MYSVDTEGNRSDDYVTVKNNLLRHDVLKLGMHIFGYLLEESKAELERKI